MEFCLNWSAVYTGWFLGPRGSLIQPSIPVRPPALIFPEFTDDLKYCRQASGTPQIVYFLKTHDVSYLNSDKNFKQRQMQRQIHRQMQRQIQIKGEAETPMV